LGQLAAANKKKNIGGGDELSISAIQPVTILAFFAR
jgi:hypothetical protein